MKSVVRIGLLGVGTVGRGVAALLRRNRALIESKVGTHLEIAAACDLRLSSVRRLPALRGVRLTTRAEEILSDPRIDIVVELIGGYEPARRFVLEALRAGKHVVTANKALLAKYWKEVFTTARQKGVLVYFEASVAGGIPVLQALNEGLAANRISKIAGILNGTTNFILTRMTAAGIPFEQALREAQEAGFAEADPSFDIRGIDAAHKLSVLASLASGTWVKLSDVTCEGIVGLDVRDLLFARQEFGYAVKLLGIAKFFRDAIEVRVHPALIPGEHPFANVSNEYNAVLVEGDAVGDVILYGKGAGSMAAASAVVSDIMFLARQVAIGSAGRLPWVTYDPKRRLRIRPADGMETRYYLRFTCLDKPGVLSRISGVLAKNQVSISAIYQPEHVFQDGRGVPVLVLTHQALEGSIRKSLAEIDRFPFVTAKTVRLRIEE